MQLRRRLLGSLATGLLAGLVALALLEASAAHDLLSADHADGSCVACAFAHADRPAEPVAGAMAPPLAGPVAALPRADQPAASPIPLLHRGRGPPSLSS
jgi:hypothetical protein